MLRYAFTLIVFFFSLYSQAFAQYTGKVVSISDGDTFTILDSNSRQVKVRLHGIDCPERKQDYGQAAKQFLSRLIFQKYVQLQIRDTDRYGRTIAIGYLSNGVSINEELLRAGYAWHYKAFDKNIQWDQLELLARNQRKGLWNSPNPLPPWEFRKQSKNRHTQTQTTY